MSLNLEGMAAGLELGGLVRYAKDHGVEAPGVLEAIASMGEWELRTMLLLAVGALADARLDDLWQETCDLLDEQGPKETTGG